MSERIFDVVHVGYGPVSKTLAIMLARLGHDVAIFERFGDVYPLPRAVCIDHEIYRVLHANGLGPQLKQFTSPAPKYRWFSPKWEELLCIDWTAESVSGGSEVNFVHQPSVERSLDQVVRTTNAITLEMGWEAIDARQENDFVELTVRNTATQATKTVRARYLVGLDGANSFVRGKIGGSQHDLGFEADWLVIDLLLKPGVTVESLGIPECGQYCNPVRPTTIVPGGIEGDRVCRRWEFMRLPHETKAELEKDEKVWELLGSWIRPDQADVVRHTVYSFRSLVADRWRDGRMLIAGDAAHVMPPFMGQGMCSGLRDAWNLAWKLNLVLKGVANDHILDTYQVERAPHVSDIIKASIFLGKIICIPDVAEAAKRDEMFLSGKAPPPAPFPILTDGLLNRGADGKPAVPAGQLSPHGLVYSREGAGRFDDVVGLGFVLLLNSDIDPNALSSANRAFLAALGARIVVMSPSVDSEPTVIDLQGKYSAYLAAAGLRALIVRPDFYVFGGASDAKGADRLIDDLRRQMAAFGISGLATEKAKTAAE